MIIATSLIDQHQRVRNEAYFVRVDYSAKLPYNEEDVDNIPELTSHQILEKKSLIELPPRNQYQPHEWRKW